jgi:hypothetical protein
MVQSSRRSPCGMAILVMHLFQSFSRSLVDIVFLLAQIKIMLRSVMPSNKVRAINCHTLGLLACLGALLILFFRMYGVLRQLRLANSVLC